MQAEKPLPQPSTQSNLESRLTGQTPGSRSKLQHEAATLLPALGTVFRPEARSPVWKEGSREKCWEFQHSRIATSLWPLLRVNPFSWAARASEEKTVPKQKTVRVVITQWAGLGTWTYRPHPQSHFPAPTLLSDFARIARQRAPRTRPRARHRAGAQTPLAWPFPAPSLGQRLGRLSGGDKLPPGLED